MIYQYNYVIFQYPLIGALFEVFMIELLSPAGSMDSLRAAVQNGANAV